MNLRAILCSVAVCGACAQEFGYAPPYESALADGWQRGWLDQSAHSNSLVSHYTVALESELGGGEPIYVPSLDRTLSWEFLCSARGVAMQGVGITIDRLFVKWIRGGGTWVSQDGAVTGLSDCSSAHFEPADGVIGAIGEPLIPHFSIAVDPDVIKLGSSVWIESAQQWFWAVDTGGLIRDLDVDVFIGVEDWRFRDGPSRLFVTSTWHEYDDPPPPPSN